MYKDQILDLYKKPMNEGRLEDALEAEGENSSCGDKTEVFVKVEDGVIQDIKHQTEGCAISTAAVSIASEELVGMEVEEVKELDRDWMVDEMGIDVSPMRVKCAVLGLKTVQNALEEFN
jgi:nitrogen fixation NifU-like protein